MANYVLTLALKTELWQEHILEKRLNIARMIYNSCLSEILKRYRKLLENIKNGAVFHSEEKVAWECMDCGYLHYGNDAPGKCPVCGAEKAKFKRRAVNY